MLVLDTDLITIVQLRSGEEYQRLDRRLEDATATTTLAVTIVSVEEQTRGWLAQIAAAKTEEQQVVAYARFHRMLREYHDWRVLDFDDTAAQQFARLKKAKLRIGTMDLRIAAITLAHDATLLSRNLADFRKVPALRVEDWTVAATGTDPAPPTS